MIDYKTGRFFGFVLLVMLLSGCNALGPKAISNGRVSYNEALAITNDQQILAYIVRTRYGQSASLLAVASVTANFKLRAAAGAQFGIGSDENFAGNLVPLSAGIAYEENPTISYGPVQGEKYTVQLMSPLPLDLTLLLLGNVLRPKQAMAMLMNSVNGIRNPKFLLSPSLHDPRFARLIELKAELIAAGYLDWIDGADKNSPTTLVIHGYAAEYVDKVKQLYQLYGLPEPADLSGDLVLPISIAVSRGGAEGVAIQTRSVFDLIQVAAASVDVPAEHVEAGWALTLPPLGLVGDYIRIRSAKRRPSNAAIAVQHEGWWFYIDQTDEASKLFFRLLETLFSVRIADSVDHKELTPRLMLPVN